MKARKQIQDSTFSRAHWLPILKSDTPLLCTTDGETNEVLNSSTAGHWESEDKTGRAAHLNA